MANGRVKSDVVVQGERKIFIESLGVPVDGDAWVRKVEVDYGAVDVRCVKWKDPADDPAIEVHHLLVMWWLIPLTCNPPNPPSAFGKGGKDRR